MSAAPAQTADEALAHVRRCDDLPFPTPSRELAESSRLVATTA